MSKRKFSNRIFSAAMMTIMTVSLLAGVPSKGVSEVQAATALSNPRNNGGVVTWDCVYFGRYPQSDKSGLTKEAIKWRVLSTDGKEAYLVAGSCPRESSWKSSWERTR